MKNHYTFFEQSSGANTSVFKLLMPDVLLFSPQHQGMGDQESLQGDGFGVLQSERSPRMNGSMKKRKRRNTRKKKKEKKKKSKKHCMFGPFRIRTRLSVAELVSFQLGPAGPAAMIKASQS